MKNVLFISYFWPPSGKASLHWPLFVMKHLPKFGWRPSLLTVDEDSFSHTDESLLIEIDPSMTVVKTAANEPFGIYRRFLGKRSDAPLIASETISLHNTDWKHRLAIWIRMNLFVPDARIGWYLSAVKGGSALIQTQRPKAIVSLGPPHSSHLIGKKLSNKYGIPHIPVLIDPWVDIVYYKDFKRNPLTIALDSHYERSTFKNASMVIFVTQSSREEYLKKYPWLMKKSQVLYWGYNEEAFADLKPLTPSNNEEIVLHAGNIFDYQNPAGLWKNMRQEIENGRKLRLRFVGTVSPGIKEAVSKAGLDPITEYVGFLPYNDMVHEMVNATYLLVCATEKRHLPGKLFECIRSGNRIIAFGDDNEDIARILKQADSGVLFPYQYTGTDIFTRIRSVSPKQGAGKQFSREEIARKLAELMDTLQ
jgi:glycosyltransferase involved in cell wall biosynthesis